MSVGTGFSRDATGALITADVGAATAPFAPQVGFLRDANYSLVTITPATTPAVHRGFARETAAGANYGALVTVPYASAVGPLTVQQGFLRDANYALVTVSSGLAAAPTGYQLGLLRDANYALVTAAAGPVLTLQNSFEGGTNTTTISTANSGGASGQAFDAVTIGASCTCTFSNTSPGHGSALGMSIVQPATPAATYVTWTTSMGSLLAGQTLYGRFYFVAPTASIATTWRLMHILNGSTVLAGIAAVNTVNNFQFRGSADTAIGPTSAPALSAGTVYRLEWQFTGIGGGASAGGGTLHCYLGDSGTDIAGFPITMSGVNLGSLAPNAIRFGICTAAATASSTYYFDGLQVNTSGFPGVGG